MRRLALVLALVAAGSASAGGAATRAGPSLDPAHLPPLPRDVLAVERGKGAVLVGVDRGVIGRLDRYGVGAWRRGTRALFGPRGAAYTIAGRRLVALRGGRDPALPGRLRGCRVVGAIAAGRLVGCAGPRPGRMPPLLLLRRDGSSRALVAAPPHAVIGEWTGATASPDGRRLLLQWSAECETPYAFLAAAAGGRPVSATGGDWRRGPESVALGWTVRGRALAYLPGHPGCGGGGVSGVYAVDGTAHRALLVRGGESALFHP